jgi:hypothetical protein
MQKGRVIPASDTGLSHKINIGPSPGATSATSATPPSPWRQLDYGFTAGVLPDV